MGGDLLLNMYVQVYFDSDLPELFKNPGDFFYRNEKYLRHHGSHNSVDFLSYFLHISAFSIILKVFNIRYSRYFKTCELLH